MALLRIIGLRQHAASYILLAQVLLFTIPGILVGILVSMGLYACLAILLNHLLLLNLPLLPPFSSFLLSILVGFLAPLVAAIPPIYSLIKEKLSDSLDIQHSVEISTLILVESE